MHAAPRGEPIVAAPPRSDTPVAATFPIAAPRPWPRRVLWVGPTDDEELSIARRNLVRLAGCIVEMPAGRLAGTEVGGGPRSAVAAPPRVDCILLAVDRPGRWSPAEVLAFARRSPLTPIFTVATSLADGRRRSGPPLPGIEELPWHDAAGRLARWFADLDAGLPGSLGLAPTVRREDRFLEGPTFQPHPRPIVSAVPVTVTVAARTALDLEGLADLLAAAGHPIGERNLGRPDLAPSSPVVVWDAGRFDPGDLEWIRLLVANRPGVAVVVLDSFPRGDAARLALRAGADAVLGRPVALEVLAGTLRSLGAGSRRGMGGAGTGESAGFGPDSGIGRSRRHR